MDFINALKERECYKKFKTIIDPIIESYEKSNFDDVLLSQHYEQVILKGIQLPKSLTVVFETHFIKLRLFEKGENHKQDASKERKEFLVYLIDELNKHRESPNGVFVFISRYIASNIHILKSQLKYTYDEIPWEEMEFCLVIFIASEIGRDWTIISHLLLDRNVILCYLNDLRDALRNQNLKFHKSQTKPINRVSIKSSVLSFHPQFNQLYEDYETLRDIYSLRHIQSYMNVTLTSEESNMRPHALKRTLQVIGENLKNTRDSPNISFEAKERVVNPAPKYLKENLTSLRDVLSHLNFINASKLPNIFYLPYAKWNLILRNVLIALKKILFDKSSYKDIANNLKKIISVALNGQTYEISKDILTVLRNMFSKKEGPENIISDLKEVYVNIVAVLYEKLVHVCKKRKLKITLSMDEDIFLLFKQQCQKLDEIVKASNFKCLLSTPIFSEFCKMSYEQVMTVYTLCSELEGFNDKLNIGNSTALQSICIRNVSRWIFETSTTLQIFDNSSIEQKITKKDGNNDVSFPVEEIRNMADYSNELVQDDNGEENAKQRVEKVCLRIYDALKDGKQKERFLNELEALKALHAAKVDILSNEMLSKDKYQNSISKFPSRIAKTLEKFCPHNDLEKIKDTVNRVYDGYGVLVKEVAVEGIICVKNYRKLLKKFCDTLNIKDQSNVIDHLVIEFKKEIETYFYDTLSQLTEIMNIKGMDNNDLRTASIEMLLLDLLEVLMSTYNFVDDTSFLDRPTPLLVGKHLRNYLAHGSPLIDTFPFDPRNSIEIHCTFFKEKLFNFNENVSYGQTTNFTLEGAKEIYCKRLDIIETQAAMFEAAKQGKMREVEDCVEKGAHPLAFDVNGNSGLKCAVKANNVDLLIYLLPQNVDESVESLLEVAAVNGCERIVEYLLKNNQEAKECMQSDHKLLHLAVVNDKKNMVRLLLNLGCEANGVVYGRTPLYIAALKRFNVTADILINHGASIAFKDNFGEQPLHAAAKSGNWEFAKMLLNKGVDIEATNHVGYTALELAAMFGRAEFLEKLFQEGVKHNHLGNKCCDKALSLAVSHGHEKCVEVLLKHKAQPKTKTKQLQTPLHIATYFSYKNIVKQLLKHGALIEENDSNFCTALHFAAFRGWTDLIKPLFKPGFKTEKLETPLHFAAYCGNKETIEALLEHEYDVIDCVDANGCTALHISAMNGYADIVKMLIKAGAKTNILNKRRNTAFIASIIAGHLDVVSSFLQFCKIAQHELNCGFYSAVAYNHDVCLVKVLLDAGADLNFEAELHGKPEADEPDKPGKVFNEMQSRDIDLEEDLLCGSESLDIFKDFMKSAKRPTVHTSYVLICNNPFIAAVQTGNVSTVKFLLENSVNINAPLFYGTFEVIDDQKIPYTFQNFLDTRGVRRTNQDNPYYKCHCLHVASVYGHIEIIELLLTQYGVDKDIRDSNNCALLWHAANNDQQNAVKFLLEAKANPNLQGLFGETALHRAVYKGFVHTACILLYHNATNIHIHSEDSTSILDMAVLSEQSSMLEMLLNYNFTFEERYNAAQNAIEFGNVEVFKMLLKTAQHGEDFFITLRDTEPPLHRAFARQHKKEIIEILLNHGVDVNAKFGQEEHTALHKAVVSIYDDKDIVELLLENHADLNMVTACGETPLNMAIREDNVEIARSLLKYGADATKPASTDYDQTDVTPLHYAAISLNCSEMLALLLEDIRENYNDMLSYINAKDGNGDTPLMWAIKDIRPEHAIPFISAGADVNLQNKKGMSALHYAVWDRKTEAVKFLIENGADVNLQDNKGMCPLHYAMSMRNTELTEFLIEYGADETLKNKDGKTAAEMSYEELCGWTKDDYSDDNDDDRENNYES